MKLEIWIDTNGCPESYHEFRREADGEPLEVHHADGVKCEEAEFSFWPHKRERE